MNRALVLFSAISLVCPQLLEGQDTVRQASMGDLEPWRQRQLAIAESSQVARARNSERDKKALSDLERQVWHLAQVPDRDRESALEINTRFDGVEGVIWRWWDPDSVRVDHNRRQQRLAENDSSASQLDAARRTGELDYVVAALQKRHETAERLQFLADSVAGDANDMANWAWPRRARLMAENSPDAPAKLKPALKAGIAYFDRLVHCARAIAEFESHQGGLLRAEQAALLQEIAVASALRRR